MENKRVPEIRIGGFCGDWEQAKIGNFIEDYLDKTTVQDQYPVLTSSQLHGIMLQDDYFTGGQVANKNNIGYFVLPRGYFTFRSRSDNGLFKFNRNDIIDKGIISYFYPVFKISNGDSDFFLNMLNSTIIKEVAIEAEGTGQKVLSLKKFKNINVILPEIKEQKEIGKYFQKLDKKILIHQQELDTLKQTKQGFLQKMFPKEGESVPEIRFPQFNSAWKECRFLEMVTIRRGLTYKPSDVSENGVRVLRSSNINEDTFELKPDDVFVKKSAINIEPVKENDILITSANGSSRLVGKHAIINNVNENMVHGGFMLLATSSQPYFINALMSSSWYDKFINVHVSGGNGAIGNLKQGDLESQIVSIPSEEEQSKIGQFFRQLDETINLHEQELETLKQTKKAFLQKMFV